MRQTRGAVTLARSEAKARQSARNLRWRFTVIGILVASFALPVLAAHLTAPEPRTRRIHIELFRYGSQPEIIHVNRGDTLILTFSSRDTPHSFLLQEYDLDVKVSPHSGQVEVARPSEPEGEPEIMREVVVTAGRPGILGFLNTKSRFRCHVWCGQMHAFEQGFFVVHPNYLHAGATGLLVAIPLIGLLGWRRERPAAGPLAGWSAIDTTRLGKASLDPSPVRRAPEDLFSRWPWLKRAMKLPGLQYWLMTVLSIGLYVVILVSLMGTTMAGGNLGVLLVWVVWMTALIVILVPLGGRAWCTICPLPMFGDALQRGTSGRVVSGGTGRYNNVFRGLMLRWPGWLSNAVPRTIMFLAFGTISVLIISQPRWSAAAILILLALGTLMPLVFELRSFCRWLCPINSFIGLYSGMGRLALRARKDAVCDRCVARQVETCLKGNDKGWACPYGLSVSTIDRNTDCGLCMECVKSCSYENISLHWRPFGLERLLSGRDEALQAIIMLTLAVVYTITFQGPWHNLRDMVDLVDKRNWGLFIVYSATLWMVALGLLPLLLFILSRVGARLAGVRARAREIFVRDVSALVPMGLFIWIAFAIPMIMVDGSFVLSTLSDPFGWGWDLFGTAGQPWWQLAPEAIPWIQSGLVLVGFTMAIRTSRRIWVAEARPGRALYGMLPGAMFLFALSFGLVWFTTA